MGGAGGRSGGGVRHGADGPPEVPPRVVRLVGGTAPVRALGPGVREAGTGDQWAAGDEVGGGREEKPRLQIGGGGGQAGGRRRGGRGRADGGGG